MDAKTRAVEAALEKMVKAMRPIMADLFDAGQVENMAALQRAMNALNPLAPMAPAQVPVSPPEGAALGAAGKDGRAPRGAVRQAVMSVLKSRFPAGATTGEVIAAIDQQFAGEVSGVSARNELGRNKDKLYSQDEKGEWRLLIVPNPEPDDLMADMES